MRNLAPFRTAVPFLGIKLLRIWEVCPQNCTAVLKGLRHSVVYSSMYPPSVRNKNTSRSNREEEEADAQLCPRGGAMESGTSHIVGECHIVYGGTARVTGGDEGNMPI